MTRAELIEAMAKAFDREEAAQMGEPSPWSVGDIDPEWISERAACAEAALSAIEQAGLIERAFRDGLAYGSNVADADPDIAWQQSRIRHELEPKP